MNPPFLKLFQLGIWVMVMVRVTNTVDKGSWGQQRGSEAVRAMLCREQAGTDHRGITCHYNEERRCQMHA